MSRTDTAAQMPSPMSQTASAPDISPRLTKACAVFCLLVAAALPLLAAITSVSSPTPSYWAGDIGAPPADHLRPLGAALAVIPSLLLARGLFLASRCLRRFSRGELFT